MGWFGNIGIASPAGTPDMQPGPDMLNSDSGKRKYRELKRLPADIRAQVALLKVNAGTRAFAFVGRGRESCCSKLS